MKSIILLLCLISFAPFAAHAYKHKTEAEISQMTPAQRVDEYADEQAYHTHHDYYFDDKQSELINKYIRIDGAKAFSRVAEIIDEYDPTRSSGKSERKAERFDGAFGILSILDNSVVRVRASAEGRRAIDALEKAVGRMRAAGYGQPGQYGWKKSGRSGFSESTLKNLKGIGSTDEAIQQTLQFEYKVFVSDERLLNLSNFLVTNYSDYPSWSERIHFRDFTQFNYAGNPSSGHTLRNPKRFYEVYLEFEKAKD